MNDDLSALEPGPIDLVCCWVQLDEEYNSLFERVVGTMSGGGKHRARFRELGELKYSIPMAIKNMPWLRRIYIVTNGQRPPESILSLSKVTWVTHDEIIPEAYRPTFNYHAIEPFLSNIPGLADYFMVTSDDFFVAKPLSRSEFLGKQGQGVFMHTRVPLHFNAPKNMWQNNLESSNSAISRVHGNLERRVFPHLPQLYEKAQWNAVLDIYADEVHKTATSKVREPDDCIFRILYTFERIYGLWGTCDFDELVSRSSGDVRYVIRRDFTPVALRHVDEKLERDLEIISETRPSFFCLNDATDVEHEEKMRIRLSRFLEQMSSEENVMRHY